MCPVLQTPELGPDMVQSQVCTLPGSGQEVTWRPQSRGSVPPTRALGVPATRGHSLTGPQQPRHLLQAPRPGGARSREKPTTRGVPPAASQAPRSVCRCPIISLIPTGKMALIRRVISVFSFQKTLLRLIKGANVLREAPPLSDSGFYVLRFGLNLKHPRGCCTH